MIRFAPGKAPLGLPAWLSGWFARPAAPEAARTLADMKPGQKARVVSLDGKGPLVQRLYEMGLIEGTEVTLVRRAPLGDPLEIRLMGYSLSLRGAEASRIHVTTP